VSVSPARPGPTNAPQQAPSPAVVRAKPRRLRVQPGSHDETAEATKSISRREAARLSRESVAGGAGGGFYGYGKDVARALPQPIDDLARDFGNDVYEQMMLDPQVASCLAILKASILEDGVNLASPVEDQDADDYELAMAIRNTAARMFDRMDTPMGDVLWSMCDALALGNKVAEIVCALETNDGKPGGKKTLMVKAIKPKPRQMVRFVVDAHMTLVGIMGAKPGQSGPTGEGAVLTKDSKDVLPLDKFAILTHRPQNGDPRGTSILRAAYAPWWEKRQMKPEYLRYLSQFAGPSVWATTPEDATSTPATDGLGNLVDSSGVAVDDPDDLDPGDLPEETSPQDELLETLLAWRNGTSAAFAFGTEVHALEMQGDGNAFLRCFAESDEQITKAILTQSLATEEGTHMARAAASVHQDVLDTLVRHGKQAVIRMLSHQILRPWVERNWGPEKLSLVPLVTLGTTEQHDLPVLATAVAALQRSNFIHPSQYPYFDRLLGAPVRDLTVAPNLPLPGAAPAPGEPSNAGDRAGMGNSRPDQGPKSPKPAGQPAAKPAAKPAPKPAAKPAALEDSSWD
jgi:hypothetical protein